MTKFYAVAYVRGSEKQRKVTIPKSLWHVFHVGSKVCVENAKTKSKLIKIVGEESNGKQRMFTINKKHWTEFPLNCECKIYTIKVRC